MTRAGATIWLVCLVVLEHVVANMDSFDSGLFSCSTPGPKPSPRNPFKPGNPFRDDHQDTTLTPESTLTAANDLWNTARGDIGRPTQHTSKLTTRRFAKPIKLPDDYDGRTCLRDYLRHFDRCTVINGWSLEESAVFLSAALRGEAQKILHGMSDSDCNDYSKLVARLELRFGVEKQAELFQAKLHNRRQQDGESLKALSADIRSMSSLAYQDLAPSAQERFAVQHFIDAVSDVDDRMRLRRDKPRTLDEALLTACELEAFRTMDTGLPSLKPQLRSVENINKETNQLALQVEKLTQQIQAQEQRYHAQQDALRSLTDQVQKCANVRRQPQYPQYSKPYKFLPRQNVECWSCKQRGHFQRDCPSFWNTMSAKNQFSGNERKAFPAARGNV